MPTVAPTTKTTIVPRNPRFQYPNPALGPSPWYARSRLDPTSTNASETNPRRLGFVPRPFGCQETSGSRAAPLSPRVRTGEPDRALRLRRRRVKRIVPPPIPRAAITSGTGIGRTTSEPEGPSEIETTHAP